MAKRRRPDEGSGEDALIARYFRPLATHPGALNLQDDAATLSLPRGHELVITADALIAGVHFFADDPPESIAQKALRMNLSDLAAKGATPAGFLLSLALPPGHGEDWLRGFSQGLRKDARRYGCPLIGGDTVRSPERLMLSITALGTVPKGNAVRRTGARPGDVIVVSGTIGDAALGLLLRQGRTLAGTDKHHAMLRDRYLLPQPRTALAAAVLRHADASMDVSDGLVGDLSRLCRASKVSAEVEADAVPLSAAAKAALAGDSALLESILTGGDDYEIIGTVPPKKLAAFRAAARAARVPVAVIGAIKRGQGVRVLDGAGRVLRMNQTAYSHF